MSYKFLPSSNIDKTTLILEEIKKDVYVDINTKETFEGFTLSLNSDQRVSFWLNEAKGILTLTYKGILQLVKNGNVTI